MSDSRVNSKIPVERHFAGKVLVTGAAGHLGANLVHELLRQGRDVRVMLRDGSNNAAMDGLPVERLRGDLRDPRACDEAVRDCETVYHCAAKLSTINGNQSEKREIFECNVLGTRNILRAARAAGVERTVVTGSFSAVGHDLDEPGRPADETVPFFPFEHHLPYARSKVLVEHECLKAAVEGQDVVIATSCAILGPHDYKPSRMGQVLIDLTHGRLRAYIPGGGFEFVAARDIVAGHLLAMSRGRSGQKYVFASEWNSLEDVLKIYSEVSGKPLPRLRLPAPLLQPIAEITNFLLANFFPNAPQGRLTPAAIRILTLQRRADLTKAKTELGYEPTDIRSAVAEAYDDFARRGLVPRRPQVQVPVKPAAPRFEARAAAPAREPVVTEINSRATA
ncbi:MAG: NAD-dependent epimerase/dehydratase family protein [Myxococcales bacterium]|nr:NAD-dependent epimerase/dehydratase family protein [Myxococcales bacterium]